MAGPYRIERISLPDEGGAVLECTDGQIAWEVTLEDTSTGVRNKLQLCAPWDTGDLCSIPLALTAAGWVPNDWDTECGP